MEAPLPFVSPLAHSRKTQVTAGASSTARLLKVATKVGLGCPSFGGQRRSHQIESKKSWNCPSTSRSQSKYQASSPLRNISRGGLASSHSIRPQIRLKRS